MSAQKLFKSSLVFAFALTTAGVALAEERVGYRGAFVDDACAPITASNASYRDSAARAGKAEAVTVAKTTGGYRDAYARDSKSGTRLVATGTRLACTY